MTATIKTITAVTTGTDTFTATAHGLLTGDRFRLRNLGGALPAATPSLAPATTYYAIRVDADNVKPAASSADALANTPINLTGTGTGTHQIEYGLPYAERRTAAAGTQIFSIDDNEVWTALTSLHAMFTGAAQTIYSNLIARPETISATLGAQQNNYYPAGFDACGLLRITASAAFSFTGFQRPPHDKLCEFTLINTTNAFTITLVHESASSNAENRIILPGDGTGGALNTVGAAATFKYDSTSLRWRMTAFQKSGLAA